jgi:hypothetical protein
MPNRLPPALALCAALAALTSAAHAAARVDVVPIKDGARLVVSGKLVTIFRTPNAGLSPERRAQLAAERLEELIRVGLGAQDIEVRKRGESWGVYAAGGLVMIATPGEAAERKEAAEVTARRWAANLKAALPASPKAARTVTRTKLAGSPKTQPFTPRTGGPTPNTKAAKLFVQETSVAIPLGETRIVALSGTAQGPITVETDDEETASADLVEGKAAVQVQGLAPGKATVRVSRDGKDAFFTVWVKKYAGKVTAAPPAEVTGETAPVSLVRRVAVQRALASVQREPGARVELEGKPEGLKALAAGESAEVSFPVSITGGAYLPVKTVAKVRVSNLVLPPAETKTLLYSNDPESVREYSTLYQGPVDPSAPVRLLYHHQNRMKRAFTFQIHLLNPGDTPADVQVIEGDAGPFIDPIQVGHRAAARYMEAVSHDTGYIARVPAHGAVTVYRVELPNDQTVSGIYNFRITRGGPLVAHISAAPMATTPPVSQSSLEVAQNEPHVYTTPKKEEFYRYTVGQTWAFVPVGRKAITARTRKRQLFGNYGVVYDITVDIDNPSDQPRTVSVVLAPEAGWARGAFIIEGKLVEAPQVAPPADAVLWKVRLAPGEQRKVRIQGIPVGGSSYPVSIVVR